jgi:hypothetical protein
VNEVRDFALDAVGDAPIALFQAGKKVFGVVSGKKKAQDPAAARTYPAGTSAADITE